MAPVIFDISSNDYIINTEDLYEPVHIKTTQEKTPLHNWVHIFSRKNVQKMLQGY